MSENDSAGYVLGSEWRVAREVRKRDGGEGVGFSRTKKKGDKWPYRKSGEW